MRAYLAFLAAVCLAGTSWATTYYVDSAGGNDSNSGLSTQAPWKTVAKVNASTLVAGDAVLFKRGGVWNEILAPTSSGAAGNPISFDAYGQGPAPVLTGYLALPSTSWTLVSGNVWKATATASSMNYALFGTVWGNKQTAQANVLHDRDWYFASNTLYVFSTTGNPAAYYGNVAAMLLAFGQMIYLNGNSFVNVQHFKLTYFDSYGVRITGAAHDITVANVWAEGIIPNATLPQGFYATSTVAGANINFYNVDSHRNYNGFQVASTTGVTLKNCRAYANRFAGLNDNTANTVYSNCHFFGNTVGVLPSPGTTSMTLDVIGGTDGGNNIGVNTWPGVVDFAKYPSRISFTVDDVGLTPLADVYINTLTPTVVAHGLRMSMGIQTGFASSYIAEIQGWLAAGHDPTSHSWSHSYYTNTSWLTVQYTGTGTAAAMSFSGNHLTTTVTGGPGGENLNLDLTNPGYNTIHALALYLRFNAPGYTALQDPNAHDAMHSYTLADFSNADIKTAGYNMQLDKSRYVNDEMAFSKAWMETNIVGAGNQTVYVYPDGLGDAATFGWSAANGYKGARGTLSMDLGSRDIAAGGNGLGVNIQNVTSLAITKLHGFTAQQIQGQMAELVFKSAVWGAPYGLFCHINEVTPAEVSSALDGLAQHGAVVITDRQMIDTVFTGTNVPGTFYYTSPAAGREPNFRGTASSPTTGAGANLGVTYAMDLDGRDRGVLGWDIGSTASNSLTRVSGGGAGRGSAVVQ
jgi:hypothetical protein